MATARTLEDALRRLNAKDASLRRIDLSGNRIGVEDATALAGALERGSFPALQDIGLFGNSIGDEGARALAGAFERGSFPKLQHIWLGGNIIGDEGAKALAGALERGSFPALQIIELLANRIGNEGATALSAAFERGSFPKLQRIMLGHNNIEVEMLEHVSRAIATMHCRVRVRAFLGAELERSPVTPARRFLWRDGDRAAMVRVLRFVMVAYDGCILF